MKLKTALWNTRQTEIRCLFLCVFTSIGEKGSVFYACGNLAGMIKELYPDKEGETHSIQYGILSRKAQILPDVSNLISEYY